MDHIHQPPGGWVKPYEKSSKKRKHPILRIPRGNITETRPDHSIHQPPGGLPNHTRNLQRKGNTRFNVYPEGRKNPCVRPDGIGGETGPGSDQGGN
ncbi:hypothetical protein JTB14_015354 [Gonioctena quinquepunctata]|nr:hypothetical protein JTB14_015354 [Gonioctena quinquepunctata]